MESFRRNMKISIPESDNINSLHFPVILGAHATTIINQKGIIDSSKNIGSEWEKKVI